MFEHIGDVYHKLDQTGEAIAAWRKSLEMDPDNSGVKEKIESLQSAN